MPTARAWREYPRRYRYEAAVCAQCGKWHFPARLVCDACGGREFETRRMGRTGKILTHTIIRVPPSPHADQAPYAMAIIARIFAREAALKVGEEGLRWVAGSADPAVGIDPGLPAALRLDQIRAAQAGLIADMTALADVLYA